MHPILFTIGSFSLYSYGLMMAVGVLVALFFVDREAQRLGVNRDLVTKMVVYTFFMGLLGARVLYIVTRISDPTQSLWELLINVRSGFVYYGGLASSWLFLVWFLRRHSSALPFWPMSDAVTLGICIGLALGRVGCFLGGCCYGGPCDLPWAVPMKSEPALGPLHPVQIYEFLYLVILFILLWRKRLHKSYEGELTVIFVGSYAVARYILEFYRGDLIRGFVVEHWLSTSQFIGLIFLPIALVLHRRLKKESSLKK